MWGDRGRLSSPFDLGLGEPTLRLELELFSLAPVGVAEGPTALALLRDALHSEASERTGRAVVPRGAASAGRSGAFAAPTAAPGRRCVSPRFSARKFLV